ncbi:MAG: hypothetical protein WCQ00_02930 [bacterium]
MILTTHAVTGATFTALIPKNPILGFAIGFGSHFILDSIPHWDYKLKSSRKNKEKPLNNDLVINKDFLKDLVKIGFDGLLGLSLSFILLGAFGHASLIAILFGAIGGMMPDFLQFVYFKWRHEPLVSLQKFHIWMHSKRSLNSRPIFGIFCQVMVISIVFLFYNLLRL